MSEEEVIVRVRNTLDVLEHNCVDTNLRIKSYENIDKILKKCSDIDAETASRILAECRRDLRDSLKCSPNALSVIGKIVKKAKCDKCPSTIPLTSSALDVLQLLNSISGSSKAPGYKLIHLCCNIICSYPSQILVELTEFHFNIIKELFEQVNLQTRQLLEIINTILKILPPDKQIVIVERELQFWFTRIIPMSMNCVTQNDGCGEVVETLELLTETLVHIEYFDHPSWLNILECMSKQSRYPVIVQSLLEKKSDYWHRLWIIFIKLLKSQITKVCGTHGSPINSMLHAVECAFKMDTVNRIRAFECWKVLIDNFSTETNHAVVQKRVKLLMIPLRSNNAKIEVIAITKFKTWWHMFQKFYTSINKFADSMFIPFLHFCFGKQSQQGKSPIPPGQLSDQLKDLCVQALVEIFGHTDCEGCTTIPQLSNKLIDTHLLTTYWEDWNHSLKEVIEFSLNNENATLSIQRLSCLFKSLLATLCELPDNNIRKDLVDYVFNIWIHNVMDNMDKPNTFEIVLEVVIPAITDERYNKLLKAKDDKQAKMRGTLCMILESLLKVPERNQFNTKYFVQKVKPLVVLWISKSKPGDENLLVSVNSWPMWTLVADSVFDCANKSDETTITVLLNWPLQARNLQNIGTTMTDVQYSASVWTNLYSTQLKMNEMFLHDDLIMLLERNDTVDTAHYFVTIVLLCVLKQKLADNERIECGVETRLLEKVLERINDTQHIENILPTLIHTAALMLNNLLGTEDQKFAITVITVIKSILKRMNCIKKPGDYSGFIQNIFSLIETLFQREAYSGMKNIILDDLISCHKHHTSELIGKNIITRILKKFLTQTKDSDPEGYSKILNVLEPEIYASFPKKSDEQFIAPEKKPEKKKKEPSIVTKVVENGEEYVVVKSNWKFNPKNLTENQKEKFKRKREDIPALYQDLSQSQDEFKLSTWKTDSQDTSTNSSKSESKTSDSNASSILKNIPSSEVVPKIIENLMSETKESNEEKTEKINNFDELKTVNSPVAKPKTPRMALKDRVFRNVRNLMEKASNQKSSMENNPSESAVVPSTENTAPRTPNARVVSMMNMVISASASKAVPEKQESKTSDEIAKTPTTNRNNMTTIVNSAPPALPADRPSRIKRKPKKFDDVHLIDLKKRRNLSSPNNSQSDSQVENKIIDSKKNTTDKQSDSVNISGTSVPIDNIEQVNTETDTTVVLVPDSKTDSQEIASIQCKEFKNSSPQFVENVNPNINKCPMESQNLTNNDVRKEPDEETNLLLNQSKSLLTPEKNKLTEISNLNKEKSDSIIHTPTTTKNQETNKVKDNIRENLNESVEFQSQPEFIQTPKRFRNKDGPASKKSSAKKKKTRIEKELAIDMVEGHPYLNTPPEKRGRKKLMGTLTPRRNNSKRLEKTVDEAKTPQSEKKAKNQKSNFSPQKSVTVKESQEKQKQSEDIPCSEDVIESSQDSTATSISIRSTTPRVPVVALEKYYMTNENTQCLLDNFDNALIEHTSNKAKKKNDSYNDTVIPCNKTATETITVEVTATMDTELLEDKDSSDVIIISEDIPPPITINTENTCIDLDTEDIANADTQSMDPNVLMTLNVDVHKNDTISLNTQDDATKTLNTERLDDEDSASSPRKNKSKRRQDFLNNTLEISPIKMQSPLREEKTPSPETSSDYVVIKLTSPVHSNGEPYEKRDSPEIFTEEKVSPDKRDLSPPRDSTSITLSSPSSSLSLKKNRPQVRSGGRAAHLLELCVPENENSINVKNSAEEESRKNPSTPARRNLRMVYNSVADNAEECAGDEGNDSGNFLKLKKSLPPVDSSPSGPILKRKLAEIADDATVSPVSKRKRVSFHDPPVSTTMSVIKYIEPGGTRSPSNSAIKRQERQTRSHANMKSPKRLDNVFKLDTVLTKAVESFSENNTSIASTNDTEMSSIEQTPIVEIVKISDLNDVDPICLELVDCNDPISNITSELSSPSMSALLTKELKGKIECIGDLAKLTEVEVNRLCIKVPKVAVAKKVLADYLAKNSPQIDDSLNKTMLVDSDMQTDRIECRHSEMQTNSVVTATALVQCEVCLASTSAQTDETGSKSTKDAISDLKEKTDFINGLNDVLDGPAKLQIANTLSFDSISTLLVSKLNTETSKQLLDSVIEKESMLPTSNNQLSFLEDYLSEKFQSKDLIMLCSNLLRKACERPL